MSPLPSIFSHVERTARLAIPLAIAAAVLPTTYATERPAPNQAAPALQLEEMIQGPADLDTDWSSFEGKVVVLEFWASWCGGCIAAVPHWNEVVGELAGEDFVFLGISNEPRDAALRCIERIPRKGLVAIDDSNRTFAAYDPGGVPHIVVVDQDGVIKAVTTADSLNADALRAIASGEDHGMPHKPPRERRPLPGAGEPAPTERLTLIEDAAGDDQRMLYDHGRFLAQGLPLRVVLRELYDLPKSLIEFQIPNVDRLVDVTVHAPGIDRSQIREYARSELTRELDIHTDAKSVEQSVCIVRRIEGLESLEPSTADKSRLTAQGYRLSAVKKPLSVLMEHLGRATGGINFINESGLDGVYDFEVQFFDKETIISELRALGLEFSKDRRTMQVTVLKQGEPADPQ